MKPVITLLPVALASSAKRRTEPVTIAVATSGAADLKDGSAYPSVDTETDTHFKNDNHQ